MLALVSILGVFALAFVAWSLLRRFGSDRVAALNDKRRATSRIVSPGEFVNQTFEFVLPNDVLARWHMLLPPRRTMASLAAEVAQ